ncbi:MAG: aldehyde ferredoxin oxidoreductase N-terminal domain-containing protein, partial [Bacteroidota bacterium]
MFGWTGKILSIDLNSGKHQIIRPEQDIYYKYIGGKGLAGYFLKDYITEAWDSTGMPLLFFTGPLVNTAAPTSGRMTVMSRSPLTGTVGDASVGGGFGSQLKKAGYDGLILTGKCIRLSGIEITGTDVRIVDSQKLKGHTNSEMSVKLSGKGALASVGPAAENGVLFASIAVDNHFFAGRNGLGLVMAGKNLKYITVTGTETTQVFDKKELNGAKEEIFRLTSASPVLMGESGIANMGTGALYDLIHARYMMPTDNFRKTRFDQAGKMNAFSYMQKYHPRRSGCRGCHILCKKTGEGKEVLPEFETMSHFSALIGNTSIETVVEANKICNE